VSQTRDNINDSDRSLTAAVKYKAGGAALTGAVVGTAFAGPFGFILGIFFYHLYQF
jgi:hypothetical protein